MNPAMHLSLLPDGRLMWIDPPGKAKVGDIAGSPHNGYIQVGLFGRRYYAHRLAWFLHYGRWPQGELDHVNGNRADNRIENLREVTRDENAQNRRKAQGNNKLGVLGVYRHSERFRAQIMAAGGRIHLGLFDTVEEAHAAYVAAKRRFHAGNTL